VSDSDWMTDDEIAASLSARSTTRISTSDFSEQPVVVVTIKGFESARDPDDKDPRPKWKIHTREFNRPYMPCVKMRRLLEQAWGKPRPEWMGRKMRLYLDPKVSYGRHKHIGGIRINALSHWEGGPISVQAGRGTEESYPVASLDVAKKPEPTFEEKRAALAQLVAERGMVDDVDRAHGPVETWTPEVCKAIGGMLRGGGA